MKKKRAGRRNGADQVEDIHIHPPRRENTEPSLNYHYYPKPSTTACCLLKHTIIHTQIKMWKILSYKIIKTCTILWGVNHFEVSFNMTALSGRHDWGLVISWAVHETD